jgi:hypothetical protein
MTRSGVAVPASVEALARASRPVFTMAIASVVVLATGAAVAVSRPSSTDSRATSQPSSAVPGSAAPVPEVTASPAAAAGTRRTPALRLQKLVTTALADGRSEGTVHTVARDVSRKYGTAVFDDYDASDAGVQHIRIFGGHLEIRVIGLTTYLAGDSRGLIRYLGFTAGQAATLGRQWLELQPGEPGYHDVTAGVTTASTLHEARVGRPLRELSERVRDHQRVVGIAGRPTADGSGRHARATLWVSVGARPLPVELDEISRNGRLRETFSGWGRRVRVAPPVHVYGRRTISG